MTTIDENKQSWTVRWENGKTQTYVPYDSLGMTSFIKKGLEKGKVTVNDKDVFIDENHFWRYKNDQTTM